MQTPLRAHNRKAVAAEADGFVTNPSVESPPPSQLVSSSPLSSSVPRGAGVSLPRYLRENPLLGPLAPDFSLISIEEYSNLRLFGLADREKAARNTLLSQEASARRDMWDPFSDILEEERWRVRMAKRQEMLMFERACESDKDGTEGLSLEEEKERLAIYAAWVEAYKRVLPNQKQFRRTQLEEAAAAHTAATHEAAMSQWLGVVVLDHVNWQEALLREERRERDALAWEALLNGWGRAAEEGEGEDGTSFSTPPTAATRAATTEDAIRNTAAASDDTAVALPSPSPSLSSAHHHHVRKSLVTDVVLFGVPLIKRFPDDAKEVIVAAATPNGEGVEEEAQSSSPSPPPSSSSSSLPTTEIRALAYALSIEGQMAWLAFEDEPYSRQSVMREEAGERLVLTMPYGSSRMLKLQETLGREGIEAAEAYARYRGGVMTAHRQLQFDLWWSELKARGVPRRWRGEDVGTFNTVNCACVPPPHRQRSRGLRNVLNLNHSPKNACHPFLLSLKWVGKKMYCFFCKVFTNLRWRISSP